MDAADPSASAAATVRDYYETLRTGDALAPYFVDDEDLVKCGVFSRTVGGPAVADALREQTRSTSGWRVDSRDLRVTERAAHAWFADDVGLGWTDDERGIRFEFDTRWSGTLERRDADGEVDPDGAWRFAGMHVSTAEDR